jgi:hypothetical protein
MAVRRKYVTAAVADAPIEPAMPAPAEAAPPAAPATPMASPEPDEPNPLRQALHGAQRAEEMQHQHRQQQQPQTVEQYIDRLPDLSSHKREFLKQHPGLLAPEVAPVMGRAYQAGLQSGLEDDSNQLDQFILSTVSREIEHHRALTSADARSTPENEERHNEIVRGADDLTSEADSYREESLAAHQPPPPATPRRTIPTSAPVSREVMSMATGGRSQASSENTLSREEREIARSSFSAPNMTSAQKELLYLQNKRKLAAARASGQYPGRERIEQCDTRSRSSP